MGDNLDSYDLDMELLKAIDKQCSELWHSYNELKENK